MQGADGIFLSTFRRSLGSKYRIALPVDFRNVLLQNQQSSKASFVAFRSYVYQAIECFSMDRMKQMSQKMDNLDPFGAERDDFALSVFADAITIDFDPDDGRMTLPQTLADYAGINVQEELVFVGKGATFQIWNAHNFEEHQHQARQALRAKRQ